MPTRRVKSMSVGIMLGGLAAIGVQAGTEVPYGHKDFYPTPERPIGFRGDGNGHWPGAEPVLRFWEGTLAQAKIKVKDAEKDVPVFGDQVSRNIVWKLDMPGWSLAQPIVVGDRIFAVCEPHFLVCVDAHSGQMLWKREVSPAEISFPPDKAAGIQELVDRGIALKIITSWGGHPTHVKAALELAQETRPRVQAIDPDPALVSALDKLIEKLKAGDAKGGGIGYQTEFAGLVARKYKIPTNRQWHGFVGNAGCTPVSDGEYVYVVFGQGQMAAYDLDGKRVWAFRQDEFTEYRGVEDFPSPLLYRDVLIVRGQKQNGMLIGLDRRTGKPLWQWARKPYHTHGSFATSKVMELPGPDGTGVVAVVVSLGAVIRATDGKVLGTFEPPRAEWGHGPSIVGHGSIFLHETSGDAHTTPLEAYRMTWAGPDELKVDLIRQIPAAGVGPFGQDPGALAWPLVVGPESVWDATTGRKLSATTCGGASPIVAGRFAIVRRGGDSNWGRERADGSTLCLFGAIDLRNPRSIQPIAVSALGGAEAPHDLYVEKHMPGVSPVVGCYQGIQPSFGCNNGGPVPQGNRIFIQGNRYLYCIGDPAVPFAHARGRRSAMALPQGAAALAAMLVDRDPEKRLAAMDALYALGEKAASAAPAVATALGDPERTVRLRAAGVLGRVGPETGKLAAGFLTQMQDKTADHGRRESAAMALRATLPYAPGLASNVLQATMAGGGLDPYARLAFGGSGEAGVEAMAPMFKKEHPRNALCAPLALLMELPASAAKSQLLMDLMLTRRPSMYYAPWSIGETFTVQVSIEQVLARHLALDSEATLPLLPAYMKRLDADPNARKDLGNYLPLVLADAEGTAEVVVPRLAELLKQSPAGGDIVIMLGQVGAPAKAVLPLIKEKQSKVEHWLRAPVQEVIDRLSMP